MVRWPVDRLRPAARRAAATLGGWFGRVQGRLVIPGWVVDGAQAAAAFAVIMFERAVTGPGLAFDLPTVWATVVTAILTGCLAVRRVAPVTAYLVGSLALIVEAGWLVASPFSPYPNLVGLFSVGLHATRRRAWWGPALMLPATLCYFAVIEVQPGIPSGPTASAGVVFAWLVAWSIGYGAARRREQHAEARRRARRETLAEERARIARELHDLVGHTVNVMLVQAGAARMVLDSAPEQAREMLIGLEGVARETLDELDHMLGALRQDDGRHARAGLPHLSRLAQRMGEAGMPVVIGVQPPDLRLEGGLDLSVYRIVQETLTNALRHGGASKATVGVRCDGRRVEIDVVDDGRGPQLGYRPGRGLRGIAERAALFSGTAEHGGGEGGGFRVRVVLPLP